MKSILLIDVDSKIPNIALMKLSEFFKNKGDMIQFEDFLDLKYSDKRYKNEDAIEIYDKYKKGLIN